jgi:hypothetical protein
MAGGSEAFAGATYGTDYTRVVSPWPPTARGWRRSWDWEGEEGEDKRVSEAEVLSKVSYLSAFMKSFFFRCWSGLDTQIYPKFYRAKRKFLITSKRRHMYAVLNIDEIKN